MTHDVPFDAAPDAGDITYRLAPIDTGFDLRCSGLWIDVRAKDDPLRASYAAADGERRVIEGPQPEVLAALEPLGYRFRVTR